MAGRPVRRYRAGPARWLDDGRFQFDDHLLGKIAEGGGRADRGGEDDAAARGKIGCLDYRDIHGSQEAITGDLRHHRQVEIEEETRLSGVDAVAQIGVGLVGMCGNRMACAFDSAPSRDGSGGSARQDADFEIPGRRCELRWRALRLLREPPSAHRPG